ncbi:Unknown protein, partial [Striga hermonthica]
YFGCLPSRAPTRVAYSLAREASRASSVSHALATAPATPSPARSGLSVSYARTLARSPRSPPISRACTSRMPKPPRLRSLPASGLHSRTLVRASLSPSISRASRLQPAPQSPTAHPTASASSRVAPIARELRSSPAQPRAPAAWPVPLTPADRSLARLWRPALLSPNASTSQSTSVTCPLIVHLRTSSCSVQLRASWADACPSPISRSPSPFSSAIVTVGSGHGSQPFNLSQPSTGIHHPLSTHRKPCLLASFFRARFFRVQGLHQQGRADFRVPEPRRVPATVGAPSANARLPGAFRPPATEVKRFTEEEMARRREKGLCFRCEEKYTPGHRCKQNYLIEFVDSDDEEPVIEEEREVEVEVHDDEAEISVHAMAGTKGPRTMRLPAWVKDQRVTVLVDNGSSQNFINATLSHKLKLPTSMVEPFEVRVANGERLRCSKVYQGVPIKFQGVTVKADLFALPLVGPDVVLGVQWLEGLGDVTTNYRKGVMKFETDDRLVTLKAREGSTKEVGLKNIEK